MPKLFSIYYEKNRLLIGEDSIYKHVFGEESIFISTALVSIDPVTEKASEQRLSKVNFDKRFMVHQDSQLLE